MYLKVGPKGENSRLVKTGKPEFTNVNEDFPVERHAKFTLLGRFYSSKKFKIAPNIAL